MPLNQRVLAIAGGYRAGGNSDLLLSSFCRGVESANADVRVVYLRDLSFTSCIGCELCKDAHRCLRFHDHLTPLYETIEACGAIVLASPAYNYNVTAIMKAFLDRLYPFYDFTTEHPRGYSSHLAGEDVRHAAVLSVGEQLDPKDMGFTLEAMAQPLEALGYSVEERMPAYGFFERGALRRDARLMEEIGKRGAAFGARLRKGTES